MDNSGWHINPHRFKTGQGLPGTLVEKPQIAGGGWLLGGGAQLTRKRQSTSDEYEKKLVAQQTKQKLKRYKSSDGRKEYNIGDTAYLERFVEKNGYNRLIEERFRIWGKRRGFGGKPEYQLEKFVEERPGKYIRMEKYYRHDMLKTVINMTELDYL